MNLFVVVLIVVGVLWLAELGWHVVHKRRAVRERDQIIRRRFQQRQEREQDRW